MNNVAYVTTPGGEELAILPRSEWKPFVNRWSMRRRLAGFVPGSFPVLRPMKHEHLSARSLRSLFGVDTASRPRPFSLPPWA